MQNDIRQAALSSILSSIVGNFLSKGKKDEKKTPKTIKKAAPNSEIVPKIMHKNEDSRPKPKRALILNIHELAATERSRESEHGMKHEQEEKKTSKRQARRARLRRK